MGKIVVKSCDCGDDAKLGATLKVYCKTCKNVIKKFSIKKPLKAAGITIFIAYGSSQSIDYALTDNRYPLQLEYNLLQACTNSEMKLISTKVFKKKKQICLCTLTETMNEISHIRYKFDKDSFFDSFRANIKTCENES